MEDDRFDLDEIDVKEMEHKSFEFNVTETKQQEKNGVPIGIIKGYASTFGNIDRFNDIISKGAFTKTIKDHRKAQRQVRMLHQHYRLALIGGFPPEFLEENDKGLFVEGHINLEVQAGKELYSLAKQGVLKDMSIGFTTKKSDTDEETGIRTLKEIRLWEISLVDEPANTQAQITDVKTAIEDIYNGNVKTISDFLKHKKGLSNEEVKAVIVSLKRLSKAQGKEYDSQKANRQVDNFLVNSLLDEIIKVQEKI
jgi:HK97 family phage prohead protease